MVDKPNMQNGTVKIRRGKRTDLPALMALLAPPESMAGSKVARHWRRLASDPGLDFYVAEQGGTIRGMVLVCYIRELRHTGWQAVLDVAVLPSAASTVGHDLLEFAKARARKRGCQQLFTWKPTYSEDTLLSALAQSGFHSTGEVLSYNLL